MTAWGRETADRGGLLPPSPPAEKATATQHRNHSGQASTGDGSGDGAGGRNERDVGGVIGATYTVSANSEPRGHRIEATARVGLNDLAEGRVGSSEQVARQRNGGSEDAVCRIEEKCPPAPSNRRGAGFA
jgi:hypothetical protein